MRGYSGSLVIETSPNHSIETRTLAATTKRLPVTVAILLTGVAMAGLVSSLIATPKGQSDYLHDHLPAARIAPDVPWETSQYTIPAKSKKEMVRILTATEQSNWVARPESPVLGQALRAAQDSSCAQKAVMPDRPCRFPIRLDRRLKASHVNADYRVANVTETSLRVTVELGSEGSVRLYDLAKEQRLLRFYQTQGGWMQNSAETIKLTPPSMTLRAPHIAEKFSKTHVGINYYPASASWRDFWEQFPIETIKADLEKARSLKVNSLRIFLNHDYFDNADTRDDASRKLKFFLDMCEDQGLTALVTLFDLRPNYELANFDADIAHLSRVLSPIAEHKAILGIDIKNQADLDFEGWGIGSVEAWLTVMATHIHMEFPSLAVAVGWSEAEHATRLSDVVDFVTYHEYRKSDGFAQRLNDIIEAVDGKPVMITELGSTVWHPPFFNNVTEKMQGQRLEDQLLQAGSASGVYLWTLNDFDHVGKEVVGPLPWRQAQQRHYGILRPDGSERPAAKVFKAYGSLPQIRTTRSLISQSDYTFRSIF